ncbi:MAG: hypothetical protein ACI4PM_05300 [Butyricicoccus sp.]
MNPQTIPKNKPSDGRGHSVIHDAETVDRPLPSIYSTIDTDLARDNLENDLTAADLQDL